MKGKEENQNTVRLSTDNKGYDHYGWRPSSSVPPAQTVEGQGRGQSGGHRAYASTHHQQWDAAGRGIRAEGGYRLLYPSHKRTWTVSPVNCGRKKKETGEKEGGEEGRDKGSPWGQDKIQHGRLAQEQQAERHPRVRAFRPSRNSRIPRWRYVWVRTVSDTGDSPYAAGGEEDGERVIVERDGGRQYLPFKKSIFFWRSGRYLWPRGKGGNQQGCRPGAVDRTNDGAWTWAARPGVNKGTHKHIRKWRSPSDQLCIFGEKKKLTGNSILKH